MTRTIIKNTKNECIGWFGDTYKELNHLVEFMKDKKEVSRTKQEKNNTHLIIIVVE